MQTFGNCHKIVDLWNTYCEQGKEVSVWGSVNGKK